VANGAPRPKASGWGLRREAILDRAPRGRYDGRVIDTHCHLGSSRYRKDRPDVLARARAAGVTAFVEVAYDLPTSERSLALAGEHADVWATVGMHPHEVATAPAGAFERLAALARPPPRVAIGKLRPHFHRHPAPGPPEIARASIPSTRNRSTIAVASSNSHFETATISGFLASLGLYSSNSRRMVR